MFTRTNSIEAAAGRIPPIVPVSKLAELPVLRQDEKRIEMEHAKQKFARDFLGTITPRMSRFGFSQGQFSLIDIIAEVADQLDAPEIQIATWVAAKTELRRLREMVETRKFAAIRIMIDRTFMKRQPALLNSICATYGPDAIRVTQTHAKFVTFSTPETKLVIRTSMNLNQNPRLEDIQIDENPDLFAYITGVLDTVWSTHSEPAKYNARQFQLAL